MSSLPRRALLLGTGAVLGAYATRAFRPGDGPSGEPLVAPANNPSILNDASGLSPTPVAKHIVVSEKAAEAELASLRAEIAEARGANRPVIASGARHSMGAHSLARGGSLMTFDQSWIEMDEANGAYRCGAGTRWQTVIAALDPAGFSPAVMQSRHDFTVGASLSVNAHGAAAPFSTCGTSVRSFRMLLENGDLMTCSRLENKDVFTAATGGYGLLGIITELELTMVPNTRLTPTVDTASPMGLGPQLASVVNDNSGVQFAYAKLDISRESFLESGRMITYRPSVDQSNLPGPSYPERLASRTARMFRAQAGDEAAKQRLWWMENTLGGWRLGGEASRNALLNRASSTRETRDPNRTDIFHEYFIAPERLAAFIATARTVILSSYQELVDTTLRFVEADTESWLSYAPAPRISMMLHFSQEKSVRAERDMVQMTRRLIDAALASGGSYYLPYRPHARQDQFEKAYPGIRPFAAKKRAMDPRALFRNGFWDNYVSKV